MSTLSGNVLAHITVPPGDFPEPLLYVRSESTMRDGAALLLSAGQRATFDTAFGLFPAGRWRRLTTLSNVSARVHVEGRARVNLVAVTNTEEDIVDSVEIDGGTVVLSVPNFEESQVGTLYVAVTAIADHVKVHGGEWTTSMPASRDVTLGVAITTFNRQEYVLKTISRLVELERSVVELAGRLRVVVVDNAQNLQPELPTNAPVTVIPNPNLGGAGGFARGIMTLRDGGWASHIVVMDDDILLEPESVVRTVSLLSYARSVDLCVHGAMMSEEQPWMQFEAGANYEFRSVYPLRAVGRLDDMRDRSEIIHDAAEIPFDYTAWWFTVFPVHLANENPLPVFVRGDDVAYGLLHTGRHTVTLPGIVVWHADFALKNNPSSLYYEVRNFALIDTLIFDEHKWWHLAWRYLGFGFRNLYSHRYASCEYMVRGMEQFLAGPEEWMKIDHAVLHDELRRVNEEKAFSLTDEQLALGFSPPRPKVVRLAGFLLAAPTLGGSLIPKFFRARRIGVAQIDVRAVGLAIRHDEILYRHPRLPEGYICRRDRERFKQLQKRVFRSAWVLMRSYRRLKKNYRAMYPQLVSDGAWRERFGATP